MISCTEFIPMYSEMFKYMEEKDGHDAVMKFWHHIADIYVRERLGKLAAEKGLAACWEYWSHSLNEEAADFVMTYDEEAQTFDLDMRYCPSCGMLNEMKHMEPYYDYCGHCEVLYAPILAEYGVLSSGSWYDPERACCHEGYYVPKADQNTKE